MRRRARRPIGRGGSGSRARGHRGWGARRIIPGLAYPPRPGAAPRVHFRDAATRTSPLPRLGRAVDRPRRARGGSGRGCGRGDLHAHRRGSARGTRGLLHSPQPRRRRVRRAGERFAGREPFHRGPDDGFDRPAASVPDRAIHGGAERGEHLGGVSPGTLVGAQGDTAGRVGARVPPARRGGGFGRSGGASRLVAAPVRTGRAGAGASPARSHGPADGGRLGRDGLGVLRTRTV
jgi:hypothetical protein